MPFPFKCSAEQKKPNRENLLPQKSTKDTKNNPENDLKLFVPGQA